MATWIIFVPQLPRCWLTSKPDLSFTVAGLAAPARLDQMLRSRFPDWGRQAVQRLIAARGVQVNDKTVWLASWQVRNGDRIRIAQPPLAKPPPLAAWDDRWLLALDEHLVVVDKPAGLLSESPPQRAAPNLHTLAEQRFGPLTLLHRLDRDTSGVLVLTRTPLANRVLGAAWQAHAVQKEYIAVVAAPNCLEDAGRISARLAPHPQARERMTIVAKGGQGAVTRYAVVARAAHRWLVRLWPETGRTHQLRVHLASLQAPILGDRLYGDPQAASRLLLHAQQITLPALLGEGSQTFAAPLPPEFDFVGAAL
jgi:23S rRNA pseudouridine1911/1915/1917 synthase